MSHCPNCPEYYSRSTYITCDVSLLVLGIKRDSLSGSRMQIPDSPTVQTINGHPYFARARPPANASQPASQLAIPRDGVGAPLDGFMETERLQPASLLLNCHSTRAGSVKAKGTRRYRKH